MTKSRKRRRPTAVHRPPASKVTGSDQRLEGMRPWLTTMFAVDEAERRGDAAAALACIGERPLGPDGEPFWRPWRINRLHQVELLGPALPAWARSRWIAAQAHETWGEPGDRRRERCLELATEVRGGLDGLSIHGETDAQCKLMDSDWVYRQLFLYDLGGLSHFVRSGATSDLLSGADRVHDWCVAPMAALRLVARSSRTVTWERLDDGTFVEMPNIGSAALVIPGECVLGRVVPAAQDMLLDAAPLVVPRHVAEAVAEDPATWWQAVASHRDEISTGAFESGIVSDVRPRLWHFALCDPFEPVPSADDFDSIMARRVLALAREVDDSGRTWDDEELDPWACLHSALLDPGVLGALPSVLTPADLPMVERLAESLAAPADKVCRDLAVELGAAA
jgi:hypothetical protein